MVNLQLRVWSTTIRGILWLTCSTNCLQALHANLQVFSCLTHYLCDTTIETWYYQLYENVVSHLLICTFLMHQLRSIIKPFLHLKYTFRMINVRVCVIQLSGYSYLDKHYFYWDRVTWPPSDLGLLQGTSQGEHIPLEWLQWMSVLPLHNQMYTKITQIKYSEARAW